MVLIAVMVSAAAFTYKIKQGAEIEAASLRKIERQIRFEEDSIDLLKADWSLLTQPERLQRLAEAHQAELQLQPVDPRQFAKLEDIAKRPPGIRDIIGQSIDLIAGGEGQDNIKTGTVKQQ
jgi:hypothetical protein